jgi:hypothetical protein
MAVIIEETSLDKQSKIFVDKSIVETLQNSKQRTNNEKHSIERIIEELNVLDIDAFVLVEKFKSNSLTHINNEDFVKDFINKFNDKILFGKLKIERRFTGSPTFLDIYVILLIDKEQYDTSPVYYLNVESIKQRLSDLLPDFLNANLTKYFKDTVTLASCIRKIKYPMELKEFVGELKGGTDEQ